MNVYFISGMCVNCKVFDEIKLPEGYKKNYLEWYIPHENETLEEYTQNMAKGIDTSKPFVVVGYSMGAIIMQEMNKFLSPDKNVVISSMKAEDEIPRLFLLAKKIRFSDHFPKKWYAVNKRISNLFAQIVYKMTEQDVDKYVSYTSPEYMQWATSQIVNWTPSVECHNLHHIHGTKDQIFPYLQIRDVYTIEEGDHLMLLNKAEVVNKVLNDILLER